jgi:hypothetical protein
MMKKLSFTKWAAMALIVVAAVSCQEEPLKFGTGVDCGGCVDPIGGGGTVVIYCPDLIVNSIISYGAVGNVMQYGVAIKNIGNTAATLNYTTNTVGWQAWLSMDGVTRSAAACGSTFTAGTLGINQITWKRINCTFPPSFNYRAYKYIIVDLQVSSNVGECSSSNNTYVQTPIPL